MSNKITQQERILAALKNDRYVTFNDGWVALPVILSLGIAQYNARIFELRRKGYVIENRTQWVDGRKISWIRLVQKVEEPV